jgi:UDP-2,3-diacylglucosamine pyrophosphatase LpxH
MMQNEKEIHRRLTSILSDTKIPELEYGKSQDRYVIFSDLHMGNGGYADDIRGNVEILCNALDNYSSDYSLILLGDIEELWQFELPDIRREYGSSIYRSMGRFGERVYRVIGNHDNDWQVFNAPQASDPAGAQFISEAIKLVNNAGETRVLLVHGHQGSRESDKWSFLSRPNVYLYRIIEPLLKLDRHKSATKSMVIRGYERIMYSWASKNRIILICGHSHRAIFASRSYVSQLENELIRIQRKILKERRNEEKVEEYLEELEVIRRKLAEEQIKNRDIAPLEDGSRPKPCYFNSGCGIYSNGVTCIEIEGEAIRLVKWNKDSEPSQRREVFAGCEGEIGSFLEQTGQAV